MLFRAYYEAQFFRERHNAGRPYLEARREGDPKQPGWTTSSHGQV